ncbi:exonuclease RecJ [Haloferacaceae archaeon DSL9]
MSDSRVATDPARDPAERAARLGSAPFVRLSARASGDAIAASGLLAAALRRADVPFHLHTRSIPETTDSDGDALVVELDTGRPDALGSADRPASVEAYVIAEALDADPDPVLALAGVVAAGTVPGENGSGAILEAADRRGSIVRRPGVSIPTADLGAGLAGSTLFHAPFSGDVDAARAALAGLDLPAELDEDAHRRLASYVAVETATAADATPRAATAVERALRPYATPTGPFETLGGYADVLDALAREQPGLGIALALGTATDAATEAVAAWRTHAAAAHDAVRAATTNRYDGLAVVRVTVDSPSVLPAVGRLYRDFRSPEPVVLAVAEGTETQHAALVSVDPCRAGATVRAAAAEFGGRGGGTETEGCAQFDGANEQFIAAVREGHE